MVWNEKFKREIPKGWKASMLAEEIELQYGFPFSTELFTEQVTSVPVVRIRDILDNSVSAYTTEEVSERYLLQKQDLLIGMDGNFHINYWTDNVSYLNQRSVRLRARIAQMYLLFKPNTIYSHTSRQKRKEQKVLRWGIFQIKT